MFDFLIQVVCVYAFFCCTVDVDVDSGKILLLLPAWVDVKSTFVLKTKFS